MSTAPIRSMLGLIRMAADALRPAPSIEAAEGRSNAAMASAQNAAAGTSLMMDLLIERKVGLVAMSHAAASPMPGESILRPIMYVDHTSRPPVSGTTENIAQCP